MITNQNTTLTKKVLPASVKALYYANFGSEQNIVIADKFSFSVGQTATMTMLIGDIFKKNIPFGALGSELMARLNLSKEQAKAVALELCFKRFLVADKEWFGGEVASAIRGLGADPESQNEYLIAFREAVKKEEADKKREEAGGESEEDKIASVQAEMIDPEEEKKAVLTSFTKFIKFILESADFPLKLELNIRIITLLIQDDESKRFQKDLLEVIYKNKEILTDKQFVLKGETQTPTIGNWLKDYIYFVGADEIDSVIKKAQYFVSSPNVKILSPEQKSLIDGLLDIYIALKNFYQNADRMDITDLQILSYTDAERDAYFAEIKQDETKDTELAVGVESVENLYGGKPEENTAVEEIREKLILNTRKEFNKLADEFENYLLQRKKAGVIACLELLAETGAIDNLFVQDVRFKELLFGYFKRNNLQGEQKTFLLDPYKPKYVQDFLKYVFLERLGVTESEGARQAAKLGNLLKVGGAPQYSHLAYLDLSDNKFKWMDRV